MNSILVVDDEADSREAVAKYLTKAGYFVRSAPNGRAALISLLTSYPDVMILDVRMPEMDGVELLEVMTSYLKFTTLPVILLTAYPEGPHIDRARELGVKRIFAKANFELATLKDCIARLLSPSVLAAPRCSLSQSAGMQMSATGETEHPS